MPPLSPLAHEARGGPVKVDGRSPIGRYAIGRCAIGRRISGYGTGGALLDAALLDMGYGILDMGDG